MTAKIFHSTQKRPSRILQRACQKWVDFLIRWSVAHTKFWMTKLMAFWVDLPQSPRKSHKCNQGDHWQQHQHGHQSNHWKVQNLRQQRQPPPLPGRCHAGSLHFLQSLILKRWNCGSWKWLQKKLTKERWNLKVSNLITSQSQPAHHAKSPAKNRPVRWWNPSLVFHLAPCFSSGLGLTSTSHTSWRPNRVQGYCKKYMPTRNRWDLEFMMLEC